MSPFTYTFYLDPIKAIFKELKAHWITQATTIGLLLTACFDGQSDCLGDCVRIGEKKTCDKLVCSGILRKIPNECH